MNQVCTETIHAPFHEVFLAASDIARWPEFMPHYRYNRYLSQKPSGGIVKTACWRAGLTANWISEYVIDPEHHTLLFRHLSSTFNLTTGMTVLWEFEESANGTVNVTISHEIPGKLRIFGSAADWILKTCFTHDIAAKSLASLRRKLEMQHPLLQSREATLIA